MKSGLKIAGWVVIIGIIIMITSSILRSCGDTADTIHREYSTSAMLKKYEYFKDLSAAIDKKRADIEYYKEQMKDTTITVDEGWNLRAELRGIVTMHNELCAEYNSGMSKFNYSFANKGMLPESNLEPLPREMKPYILSTK